MQLSKMFKIITQKFTSDVFYILLFQTNKKNHDIYKLISTLNRETPELILIPVGNGLRHNDSEYIVI